MTPLIAGLVLAASLGAPLALKGSEVPPPPSASTPTLEEQLAELQARLDSQSQQLRQLAESVNASKTQDERSLERAGYNYQGGFVLKGNSVDGDDSFRMVLNSWVQMRHTAFDSDGPNPSENDFELERARLVFSGHALTPSLTYFIQLDGDNDRRQSLSVLDWFLSYDLGAEWLDLDQGRLGIRAGQWKLPFNRARRESGQQLAFTDRSMASLFFDIDRSVGIGLYGRLGETTQSVNWEAAVFNGFRTPGARAGRVGDLDQNLATSGRVFMDVLGEWGNDGESDLAWHDCPAIRIGGGYAVGKIGGEGGQETASIRTVDTGSLLVDLLPAGTDSFSMALFAADANLKFRGLTVLSEFYWRTVFDIASPGTNDLFDHGFLLQAGYFLVPQRLEALSRWSRIIGNSSSLGTTNASADECAAGLAWYIKGQQLKVVFDVAHVNGMPLSESTLNARPGDNGWFFRTQLQLAF
jgi:hypothetical protein